MKVRNKFGSRVLLKFLTRIDKKQCMPIFQEKWVIFRSSLPSMKIVVVYKCAYYKEQSYREFLQWIIFDFCTTEMLMSKAEYHSEPAFLNLLPQPEFKSWFFTSNQNSRIGPDKYLLRKALLCISQLLSGIACVQKIPLGDIVIKMIIMKYLSIISRMKATVIADGQYKKAFSDTISGPMKYWAYLKI